jgi:Mitochondrial carrier protein
MFDFQYLLTPDHFLVTPLDVVKTRLQSQEKCATGSIHFHHRAAEAGSKQLNGTLVR